MEGVIDALSPYSKAGWVLCAHFTEERTGSDSRKGVGTFPGHRLADRLHPLTSPRPSLFPWPLSRDESFIHSLTHSFSKASVGPTVGWCWGQRSMASVSQPPPQASPTCPPSPQVQAEARLHTQFPLCQALPAGMVAPHANQPIMRGETDWESLVLREHRSQGSSVWIKGLESHPASSQ